MWPDVLIRLAPFTLACTVVYFAASRPAWFGVGPGWLGIQLLFGLLAAPVLFVASMAAQLFLARRRGTLSAPSGGNDAWFQAGFYLVNGPTEEAFFRGLVQGGLGVVFGPPAGFIVGTAAYVLYHRLAWPWAETFATVLVGVPMGLAFWLLPGPPSLVGVSIAHIAATCGFLGPGPYLLRRLRLIDFDA